MPTPPEPDDDTEPGEAEPGQPVVPRRAYETERQKRQNWVERASKAETERDMLAKQLEEARKAPPPASVPPQALEPIDPARDPEGYTRRVRGVVLNERLNTSEMMALDKHGKDVVERETEYFKKRTEADPRLWNELYAKPHPYQWMIDFKRDGAAARGNRHRSGGVRSEDPGQDRGRTRRRSAAGFAGRRIASESRERAFSGAEGDEWVRGSAKSRRYPSPPGTKAMSETTARMTRKKRECQSPRYTDAALDLARATPRREIEAAKAEAARARLFKGRADEFA